MKVLIIANYNCGRFSPFVVEQVDAIRKLGVKIEYFGIVGKGSWGYLKNLPALKRKIDEFKPDLIHAHYGLSGLLATLQREVSVVVTYHGSDIHEGGLNLALSRLAMKMASYNIIVTEHLAKKAKVKKNYSIIPCGVDDERFYHVDKSEARTKLHWKLDERIVLFAGAFHRLVKNPNLAKSAVSMVDNVRLQELNGFSREQVNWALNASDCLLMTSLNEGSPQVIKEAMLCGLPIVSVNVGDVEAVIGNLSGHYICSFAPKDVAEKLELALNFNQRTEGRKRIVELQLTDNLVAKRVLEVYNAIFRCKNNKM